MPKKSGHNRSFRSSRPRCELKTRVGGANRSTIFGRSGHVDIAVGVRPRIRFSIEEPPGNSKEPHTGRICFHRICRNQASLPLPPKATVRPVSQSRSIRIMPRAICVAPAPRSFDLDLEHLTVTTVMSQRVCRNRTRSSSAWRFTSSSPRRARCSPAPPTASAVSPTRRWTRWMLSFARRAAGD